MKSYISLFFFITFSSVQAQLIIDKVQYVVEGNYNVTTFTRDGMFNIRQNIYIAISDSTAFVNFGKSGSRSLLLTDIEGKGMFVKETFNRELGLLVHRAYKDRREKKYLILLYFDPRNSLYNLDINEGADYTYRIQFTKSPLPN